MSLYHTVYETGCRYLDIKQEESETALSFMLRFHEAKACFETAVQRAAPGRSPWDLLLVVLFQKGLSPDVKRLCLMQPPAETMREAVNRARRCEWSLNSLNLHTRGERTERVMTAEDLTPYARFTPRPLCTYPGCRKPVGHTASKCFQRLRERKRRGGSRGGRGGKRAKKKLRSSS